MKLFEIYCTQNGISPTEPTIELIRKVFQDGLNAGFDHSNKLKMINDETNHKVFEYSEENWDEFGSYLADAFINKRNRLDAEFDDLVSLSE